MNIYDEKAFALQQLNRETEGTHDRRISSYEVRRSIVASREDIAAIVSYLSSLNEQMQAVRRILVAILILIVVIAIFK